MSYRLYRFGAVALPYARIVGTFGTGASSEGVVRVVGGAHDVYGTTDTPLRIPYDIIYSCWIVHYDENAVQMKLKGLQAKRGVRAKLYRYNEYNGTEHWAYARLMQVRAPWQYQRKTMQPLELQFQVLTPWYRDALTGFPWLLDDGYYLDDYLYLDEVLTYTYTLDASPKTITVSNKGNAPSRYMAVTLTAGAVAITAVELNTYKTLGTANSIITWTGTLARGKALVIDGRNRTITNDGADAYAGFALDADNENAYWFELQPGYNTLSVTFTGGSTDSTIALDYAHAWE